MKFKKCKICLIKFVKNERESFDQFDSRVFCSNKCSAGFRSKKSKIKKTCNQCKKEFQIPKCHDRKFCSRDCLLKSRKGIWPKSLRNQIGENHPLWKGDNAGYGAKHRWMVKTFGEPEKCEQCETHEKPKNERKRRIIWWANISNTYKRQRDDWRALCTPCHKKYDLTKNI